MSSLAGASYPVDQEIASPPFFSHHHLHKWHTTVSNIEPAFNWLAQQ
jgi:hypothetical protein